MKQVILSEGMQIPLEMLSANESSIENKKLNNCGPGGPLNYLIPDHLLGTKISSSCNIHDWTYLESKDEVEHRHSDLLFLKNMKAEVRAEPAHPVLKYMRFGLAYAYYGAVRMYSFLKKSTPQNIKKIVRKVL